MAKQWTNIVIPFDMFEMFTPSKKAMVFKFRNGAYEGFSFVRPVGTVRRSWDAGGGFSLGFAVEQSLDANGDVIEETEEELQMSKSVKGEDGNWSIVANETIEPSMIEALLD